MIDRLIAFAHALRVANVAVSQSELADASAALEVMPLMDREVVRSAVASCVIKDPTHLDAFNRLFDVFFSAAPLSDPATMLDEEGGRGIAGSELDAEDLADLLDNESLRDEVFEALSEGDLERLRQLMRLAVDRFGGVEKGRAVSGVYYTFRTLRQLDTDSLLKRLIESMRAGNIEEDPLSERLRNERADRQIQSLKDVVGEEVTRRLVEDRGTEAVAKTLALSLPEDIDIVHASRDELATLQRTITPLARKLAARLAQSHRSKHPSTLDFRKTMREAISSGGVPLEVYFKPPRLSKPELVLIADISGSVSSFARFTMQLVFAMSSQFSKVRSFVFIDALDEVTDFFSGGRDINEALRLVNTKAKVVWMDGHSDYGHSFEEFVEKYLDVLTKRTSVIICGDARNNYHDPKAEAVRRIKERAKHVFWLNPEPRSYWDTGDSVASKYGVECDGVFECRTLRQLEEFVREAI